MRYLKSLGRPGAGRALLVVAAVAAMVGLGQAPSGAAVERVTVTPGSGPPGTVVTVSGSQCSPGLTLDASQDYVRVTVTFVATSLIASFEAPATAAGNWSGTFTVPAEAATLPATITSVCVTNGVPTNPNYPPANFMVTGAGSATTTTTAPASSSTVPPATSALPGGTVASTTTVAAVGTGGGGSGGGSSPSSILGGSPHTPATIAPNGIPSTGTSASGTLGSSGSTGSAGSTPIREAATGQSAAAAVGAAFQNISMARRAADRSTWLQWLPWLLLALLAVTLATLGWCYRALRAAPIVPEATERAPA
jgi:hypothetical protein